MEYAVKKSIQAQCAAPEPWKRVHDYAVLLNAGVIDERAAHKRDVAVMGSEMVVRQQRAAEYTHNFERYKVWLPLFLVAFADFVVAWIRRSWDLYAVQLRG
jgi:hypothetical protein